MYHIAGQCFLVCRSYKSRAGRLFVNTTLSTTYENQPCFAPMFLRGQSRVHSTIQLIINNLSNIFLLVICMSSGKTSSGKTSSGHTVIPHKPLVCPYHINYAKLSQTQHIKPIIPGNTDIALQQLIKSGSTLRSTPDKQYNRTQSDNMPWPSDRKRTDGSTTQKATD